MKDTHKKVICTNYFKNSDVKQRKNEYNNKWITLINLYEKGKRQ